jgi:hypothetical protein
MTSRASLVSCLEPRRVVIDDYEAGPYVRYPSILFEPTGDSFCCALNLFLIERNLPCHLQLSLGSGSVKADIGVVPGMIRWNGAIYGG